MEAIAQPVRAAQYIRMSTDHQRYSLTNQKAEIAKYAAANGFDIVETFADAGRSGLTLEGRRELKRLFAEIMAGTTAFDALLVFDVSRWGRFQDADESAHYEWLVRQAGIPVHYCAETFENDGSLTSSIMKSLKRVMAGEYSRELSHKTWTAQMHQFALGFRMGSPTRYGLRRLLVAPDGSPKMVLEEGEYKNIRDDRVILVPGPANELAVVRRIFRLSIRDDLSDPRVAAALNDYGIPGPGGRPWKQHQIKEILTGEIYTGTATFNRVSSKLGGRKCHNPPGEWVRIENAFPPIVSRRIFLDAQKARRRHRPLVYSNKQLLERLQRLLDREGKLTLDLIERAPDLPHPASFRRRFGSLHAAFAEIDYYPPHRGPTFGPASLRPRNTVFAVQVGHLLKQSGAHVRQIGPVGLFRVDRRLTVAATVSRFHDNKVRQYWKVSLNPAIDADYVFIGLLAHGADHIERYYLLPLDRFPSGHAVHFSENAPSFERYRVPDIISLYPALLACEPRGLDVTVDLPEARS